MALHCPPSHAGYVGGNPLVRAVWPLSPMWDDDPGARVAAVGTTRVLLTAALAPDSSQALQSLGSGQRSTDHEDQPGVGDDDDPLVDGVPIVLRPLSDGVVTDADRGPLHDEHGDLGETLTGRRANIGPRWSMIRYAADSDTPNSGARRRMGRFVRQYAATSRARSSAGRLHGRPLRTTPAPSRRSTVTSFPKARGLSPENGASGAAPTP